MRGARAVAVVALALCAGCVALPVDLKPTAGTAPVQAVQGLIARVLGEQFVPYFELTIQAYGEDGLDEYTVAGANGGQGTTATVSIKATSGVALAAGLYAYMKVGGAWLALAGVLAER